MEKNLDAKGLEDRVESERLRIEASRLRDREHSEIIAPLVNARIQQWAADDPRQVVGGLRDYRKTGYAVLETGSMGAYAQTSKGSMTAAELARFTVVSSHDSNDCVFGFCKEHSTACSHGYQGGAAQSPTEWCPDCMPDSQALATAIVLARDTPGRRIGEIKASKKNRITKTTQIAVERRVITADQARQLMGIWQELQT